MVPTLPKLQPTPALAHEPLLLLLPLQLSLPLCFGHAMLPTLPLSDLAFAALSLTFSTVGLLVLEILVHDPLLPNDWPPAAPACLGNQRRFHALLVPVHLHPVRSENSFICNVFVIMVSTTRTTTTITSARRYELNCHQTNKYRTNIQKQSFYG
jgi:hypothetical protein